MAASPAPALARPTDKPAPEQPLRRRQPATSSKLGLLLASAIVATGGIYVVSAKAKPATLTTTRASTETTPLPAPGPIGGALRSAAGGLGGLLGQPTGSPSPAAGQPTPGSTSPGAPDPTQNPTQGPTATASPQPAAGAGGNEPSSQPSASGGCAVTSKLVPTCSGALFGLYIRTDGNWTQNIADVEQQIGRKVTVVKRYHDFSGAGSAGAFPTAEEKQLMASGHIMHFAWTSKIWGSNATPSWAAIAAGKDDGMLHAEAARLAAVTTPFFLDFDHEMDGKTRSVDGSPAEYVAAYRHIHALFAADGVTKAVWAWVPTGYQNNWSKSAAYYPGNDVVDWIGYDPYNLSTSNWQTPLQVMKPFYDWLDNGGLGSGAAAKPRMLGEYGSIADPNNPQRRAHWLGEVPSALSALPGLKAIEYWSDGFATLNSTDMQGFSSEGKASVAR